MTTFAHITASSKFMKSRIARLIITFAAYVSLFMAGKLIFMGFYHGMYRFADTASVLAHGLSMDLSMSAYLTIIPALLLIASVWTHARWLKAAGSIYRYFSAAVIILALMLDTALYGYWNFKLDTTPIFYFTSSPSAAMASTQWWIPVAAAAVAILLTFATGRALRWCENRVTLMPPARKWLTSAILTIFTAALFIPIRGGFTVSTMNPSRAYFSQDQRLNHAAVNPLFNFMYSATHQNSFGSQFRFFKDNGSLQAQLDKLSPTCTTSADSIRLKLIPEGMHPDIYIIILESFSSHLMPSLGGEPVAMQLDSIARTGVTFTNFYSSSFRTDRAIPAILSGYPAQPTTSIMKFVDKTDRLPSIAGTLRDSAGYETAYYYGGDINFVNQKAYLMSAGFRKVISDNDFPLSERLSKWGAHDDKVFARMEADINAVPRNGNPMLRVIQTSSSHEPFEVPYSAPFPDKRAVAFAYTDKCLGEFIRFLKSDSSRWEQSLVVLVPDHYGAYPRDLSDPLQRHRIPLVLTGGAVSHAAPMQITTPASQSDIAATLLSLLGIGHSQFPLSHDMLQPGAPQYAFFSEPDFAAMVTDNGLHAVISTQNGETISGNDSIAQLTKAFLQNLYNDLDAR